MVNYVCRTCLYVCDNEFFFKRLEKVKQVLELFIPEIKSFMGKYSLICEQCYYFLKNVEKFKVKCLETQNRIYSMNVETIKDTHQAVLQSVAKEVFVRHPQRDIQREPLPLFNLGAKLKRSKIENSSRRASKKFKTDPHNSVTSTITSQNEITLTNLLNTSVEPVEEMPTAKYDGCLKSSSADEFLKLFSPREDVDDMKNFQEFTEKYVETNEEVEGPLNEDDTVKDKQEVIMNYEEEEYMSKSDLVAAGFFSDDSNKSTATLVDQTEAATASVDDVQIIEIEISDDEDSAKTNSKRVEIKISNPSKDGQLNGEKDGHSLVHSGETTGDKFEPAAIPTSVIVKKEILEDENPGFFNKQSADGYYKCRLCDKQYKTSHGLYMHTKKIHGNEVKFHHCYYCSFFTIWKTSLIEHNNSFHAEIIAKNNASLAKCFHCSFQTRSKDKLRHHIMENHVLNKFIQCHLCRSRFSDKSSFSQHVKKDHMSLERQRDWNFCNLCNKIFLKEEYTNHMATHHKT